MGHFEEKYAYRVQSAMHTTYGVLPDAREREKQQQQQQQQRQTTTTATNWMQPENITMQERKAQKRSTPIHCKAQVTLRYHYELVARM